MPEPITKMKQGKAGGSSGVIVETIKAGEKETVTVISEIMNQIIFDENIPGDYKNSFIINCYKGKGDAADRGNDRCLKLLDNVMKVSECVLESLICF